MIKLAMLIPVVLVLGAAAAAVTVEGSSPVKIKAGTAYPVKCGTPLKVSAAGPASLVVDVRGKADAVGKPVELDFTRNEKMVSKNSITLKKSKDAGKGFSGLAQLVLSVPDGAQQYAITCDAPSELAMSFRLSKKAVKTNPAATEVAVEASKPAEGEKTADGGKPASAAAAGDGGAAVAGEAASPAGGDANQAYPGLFTHVGF